MATKIKSKDLKTVKSNKGSHQAYTKKQSDRNVVAIAPIGKKEIPRGTLASILRQAGLSREEFLKLLN